MKAGDARITVRTTGVVHIKHLGRREVGRKRQTQTTLFATVQYPTDNVKKRYRVDVAGRIQNVDLTVLLENEDPAIAAILDIDR